MDDSPAYGLAETASNQEILTTRENLEISLAGLSRVFADETQLEELASKLAELPVMELHWNLYIQPNFQTTRSFYDRLAEVRQQGASDPRLNPSLPSPWQSTELAEATRQQNLDFINKCLSNPEVARVYHYVDHDKQSSETDSDQQIEELATQALVDVIAPDAIRFESLAAQLQAVC